MEADQSFFDRAVAILADRSPIWLRMRAQEAARGFRVVAPGKEPWLPAEDWAESVVVSVDRDEVRLVAILAKRPGSFRRLLAALNEAKLRPVVVGVIGPIMPEIMKHLNWRCTVVGSGWEAEDQWRPQ